MPKPPMEKTIDSKSEESMAMDLKVRIMLVCLIDIIIIQYECECSK